MKRERCDVELGLGVFFCRRNADVQIDPELAAPGPQWKAGTWRGDQLLAIVGAAVADSWAFFTAEPCCVFVYLPDGLELTILRPEGGWTSLFGGFKGRAGRPEGSGF